MKNAIDICYFEEGSKIRESIIYDDVIFIIAWDNILHIETCNGKREYKVSEHEMARIRCDVQNKNFYYQKICFQINDESKPHLYINNDLARIVWIKETYVIAQNKEDLVEFRCDIEHKKLNVIKIHNFYAYKNKKPMLR